MKKLLTLSVTLVVFACSAPAHGMFFDCFGTTPKIYDLAESWNDYMVSSKNHALANEIVKQHGETLRTLPWDKKMKSTEALVQKSIQQYVSQLKSEESKTIVNQVMNTHSSTITLYVLAQIAPHD